MALIGGVLILVITGGELNIPAIIGFISLIGITTRKPLPVETQTIYDALIPKINGVAAGRTTSTEFNLGTLFTWTAEELGTAGNFMSGSNFSEATTNAYKTKLKSIDIQALLNRLLSQAPFELYWFDKTYTNAFSLAYSIGGLG